MTQYYSDLVNFGSYPLKPIDRPYNLSDLWETSIQNLYRQLQQMIQQRRRIMIMVYGYYLGELIQLSITPREKWKEFVLENKIPNEYYLYLGVTRIYQLFEKDSEQIYRTSKLSLRIIARMKVTEYQNLLQYSRDLSNLFNSNGIV